MTPEEFKLIRLKLGYETPAEFAKFLEVSHTAIYSKENAVNEIKMPLEYLMLFMSISKNKTIELYANHRIDSKEFKIIRECYAETPTDFSISSGMSERVVYNYEGGFAINKQISMLMIFLYKAKPAQLEKVGWIS